MYIFYYMDLHFLPSCILVILEELGEDRQKPLV